MLYVVVLAAPHMLHCSNCSHCITAGPNPRSTTLSRCFVIAFVIPPRSIMCGIAVVHAKTYGGNPSTYEL